MDLRSQNLRPYDSGHDELLMFENVVPQYEENSAFGLEETFEEYTNVVEGEFQERQTILVDGGDHYGVTALAFDLQEELLWMGNQGGHVTSYYGSDLQKHTSFQVHATEDIRCLHTIDDGILALTPSMLRCQMRRGIPIFTHTSANMEEMQCLLQLSQTPHTLLLGGHSRKLVEFNLNQCQEINLVEVGENGCAILRQHPRFVCCGDPSGQITLRDPKTLAVEHSIETHTGSLSDFDVHGNHLVTCGFSNRQGGLAVDRFLMIYDLRMVRAVSPIPVLLDPLLLKFMPSFSSRIAVASTIGQLQLIDTVTLSEPDLTVYQVNSSNSICLALDVSTSCQSLGVGDSGGSIHLLTSCPNAIFNAFSRPTEFADPIETYPPINIDDHLAILSSVPLPYLQSSKLLSDWPQQFLNKVYRETPPIEPEILQTMKMQGTIGYAPNPNTRLRNQVGYIKHNKGQNMLNNSDGSGESIRNHKEEHSTNNMSSSNTTSVVSSASGNGTFVAIPKRYRKIDLKFSKPGVVDDSECSQFNKTCFSGLEATLPNSYCNPILQVLYFLEPLRHVLLSHLCYNEFCLSCELSFLFHMLDIAKGIPCHSGNFLRSLRNAHEATALGLILPDQTGGSEVRKNTNFIALIQSWNRFILHQIHYELLEERKRKQKEAPRPAFIYRDTDFPSIELQARTRRKPRTENSGVLKVKPHFSPAKYLQTSFWNIPLCRVMDETLDSSPLLDVLSNEEGVVSSNVESKDAETEISRLFGSKQLHIHRCLKCYREVSRESSLLVCNLIYPEDTGVCEGEYSFCEVLRSSLCPEQTTPAWCDQCERFQPTLQSRRLKVLPTFLTVNCGMDNSQEKMFWQNQMDWLVKRALEMSSSGDGVQPTARHSPITSKPCRYGNGCTRLGCRFKHPGQNSDSTANNTTNNNPSPSHLYSSHSWLPQHIQLDLTSNGELSIKKLDKTEADSIDLSTLKTAGRQTVLYDLCAVVCYVQEEKKNLVAIVNVNTSYHSRSSGQNLSHWYIFNDFSIAPVTSQEAVWFSLDWKVPCILYWMDRTLEPPTTPTSNPITADVLSEDVSLAARSGKGITFTPLTTDETPGPGDLVAMDAEFVTLNQEESELRSDGKMATIKPSHMSVARISCIRGQGNLKGTPFIDDYISTQEEVVDYLTQFSGIKPGDLDVACSSKHLTTLKSTYLKLRYLIDNGVKFVGHGLRNDFRVINLIVPSDQVIDTVQLFYLPHQRMVSLRFLAWHYLGMKIQSETHDSIEDARAALQLYECYQKLDAESKLQTSLEEMYKVGKSVQWKVPGVDS